MSASTQRRIPVLIAFAQAAARQDAWGRLDALTAGGAVASTQCPLQRHDRLRLSFDLGAERFTGLAAVVTHAEADADGYARAELRFTDEVEKRRLVRALLDLLA